jgi:dTDP-4-amino-4,6-dideoxygalactose transaminase
MTNLQGALGVAQMDKLATILKRRKALALRYTEAFRGARGIAPPAIPAHVEPNFQSYLVRITADSSYPRDVVIKELRARGIASTPGIMAIHLCPPYRELARVPLPVTERSAESTIILPLYPQMTEAEQDRVIEQLLSLAEGK